MQYKETKTMKLAYGEKGRQVIRFSPKVSIKYHTRDPITYIATATLLKKEIASYIGNVSEGRKEVREEIKIEMRLKGYE